MSETAEEKLDRVRLMADEVDAWDLSDNDIAALRYVLDRLDKAERALGYVLDRLDKAERKAKALDWLESHKSDGAFSMDGECGATLLEAIEAGMNELTCK
jgi:hypothetical protein